LKFGIFNKFWDNQPNYLPLLNLRINLGKTKTFNLGKSIRLIDNILSKNSTAKIIEDTKLLLFDIDWRPHLVAFIVILKLNETEQRQFINVLWKRLCQGTWVSPQLLVTLSQIDPNFNVKTTKLLEEDGYIKLCKSTLSVKEFEEKKFNHDVTVNKILNSISYLSQGTYDQSLNDDNGGSITEDWSQGLCEIDKLGLLKKQSTTTPKPNAVLALIRKFITFTKVR